MQTQRGSLVRGGGSWLAGAFAVAVMLLMAAQPIAAQQVLAVVNGVPITSYDVDQRTRLHQISGGKVGGRKEPFVAGRALMTVVDLTQTSCKEMEGDHCPTPWDYCCVPQSELAPNLATVQFVGADGKPLKADLASVNGLKPLSEVVIKGNVVRAADGQSLVINATGLYVKKS